MKKNNLVDNVKYPIYARPLTLAEKLATTLKLLPIKCNICGSLSVISITTDNFRENCICRRCHSFNRQRQIAFVLCNGITNGSIGTLNEFVNKVGLSVYNTEAGGVLHNYLSQMNDYVCSEYFGDQYKGGEFVDGKMHQDLMFLSFENARFDVVISTDVFEHVADPYIAHKEVHRVLRMGGRHIFTVPFYQTDFLDEKRASLDNEGKLVFHKEPLYHVDPLRSDGVLVFNIFSIEMLGKLAHLGFRTNMYHLYNPINGILGPNGVVFEAIKER
ncbi:MAG: class I SAM-dependent methyltransferase [Chloroflexi bacterium]|nr:class I SAM-dependent methyltransferase [Chloroflexota bacterium]